MKPTLAVGTWLLLAFSSASAQAPKLEILWRTEAQQPVANRAAYRFATCPNGLTLTTSTNGDYLAVDSEGTILADRQLDELMDVAASTCDPAGRFVVVSNGWLQIFNVSEHADLEPAGRHWIAGGPTRLQVTPDGYVYVVGMAFQEGQHVFLRRFRLADGAFLGIPRVEMPFKSSSGGFNSFVLNGCLTWNARRDETVFAAANPAMLWRMQSDGAAHAVAPQSIAFRNADISPDTYGRRNWQDDDSIRNIVSLPDGRIVGQVFRGRRNPPPAGESFAYFFMLDESYQTLAGEVALPADLFPGLLSGADSEGNLYFVDLLVDSTATVTKARLEP